MLDDRSARAGLWWQAAVLVVALLAAFGAASFSLSLAARSANPDFAVRLAPFNAVALERKAEAVAGAVPTLEGLKDAKRYALAALERSPASVRAVRVLAMAEAAEGEEKRADRLMLFSRSLSRRDLPTTLYLIERAVGADDPDKALRNFDIALRTAPESFDFLFPILANALADENLFPAFDRLAATDPPWFYAFAGSVTAPEGAVVNLARILTKYPASAASEHPTVQRATLERLVAAGRYDQARRFYERVARRGASPAGAVRDPGCRQPSQLPPFEWRFASEAELSAACGAEGGIAFYASGAPGEVARQLLMLSPGSYALRSRASFEPASSGRAEWRIACAGTETRIGSLGIRGGANGRASVFRVPPTGCEAQWLILQAMPAASDASVSGTVDNVAISRQGPGA